MVRFTTLMCLAATAWTAMGCASTGAVERLTTRVSELEHHRKQLEASMRQDVQRLESLHEMLTQAEKTLRDKGANLGIRMEAVESTLPRLEGSSEALAFTLQRVRDDLRRMKESLYDRFGLTEFYLPHDVPGDADGLWTLAMSTRRAEKFRQARALFEHFEASFPADDRADDAVVEAARLLELDGDVEGAIGRYQLLASRYADGDQVAPATLRIGELSITLGKCDQAKAVYEYAARLYKKRPEGKLAARRAAEVPKTCEPSP